MVWNLKIKTGSFKQINSSFDYNAISTCNFKQFLLAIKPCFQDYFIEYFTQYFNTLLDKGGNTKLCECRLQTLLPMKLKDDMYFFVNLCIIPEFQEDKIVDLFFIITPLKEYQNEIISFRVLKGRKKNKELSYKLNSQSYVCIEDVLTTEQSEVFNFLLLGFSSSKIAKLLDKKKENIFKYNIRITERLASFFNIEFDNVKEASIYYKNCFLLR